MKLLNKYFKIVHQIYDYFDYTGGEKIFPFEDYTDFGWSYDEKNINYVCDNDYFEDEYIDKYEGDKYVMFLIKDSLNLDDCLIIFNKDNYIKNYE